MFKYILFYFSGLKAQGQKITTCEVKSQQSLLSYDVFQYFMDERDLSEGHFNEAVMDMMDIDTVPMIAKKVGNKAFKLLRANIYYTRIPISMTFLEICPNLSFKRTPGVNLIICPGF